MKKIFTLLAAVLMATGAYAQQVTATWTLGEKATETIAAVMNNSALASGELSRGSNFAIGGTRTAKPPTGDIVMTTWKQGVKGGKDNDTYLDLTITPSNGYKFTISKVEFDNSGAKTGNGRYDIEYIVDGSTKVINSNVTVPRTDEDATKADATATYHHSYTIKDEPGSEKATTIRIYFYSSNSSDTGNRELGLANVVIYGVAEATGDTREEANISWAKDEISYKIRDKVESLLPEFSNPNNLDITYTTTNPEIAEIENGKIVLKSAKLGQAVVTANFAGNDDYRPAAATLMVKVLTNKVEKYITEGPEEATFELDKLFAANLDTYAAGEIFSDANIVISAHSETVNGKVSGEYAGQKFTKSIQVRVKGEPNELDPWGEEYSDDNGIESATTSLIIEPKVNMTLYVYGRRQVEEKKNRYEEIDDTENNVITCNHYYVFEANDGKSLKFSDIDDPTPDADPTTGKEVYLNKNAYLGKWDGHEYAFGISEIDLEAGKKYNVYATGTTYQVQGIGYIITHDDPNYVRRTNHIVEYVKNDVSQTDVAGYTLSRTGGNKLSSGNKIAVDGSEYTSITFKGIIDGDQQITYTLAAPEGKTIAKAIVYAYTNDTEGAYFTKVGNHTFAQDAKTTITSADAKTPNVFTFDHIMLNTFDMEIHTTLNKNAYVVIELEVIDEEHTPELPQVVINNNIYKHLDEFFADGKAVTIKVTAANDAHHIYYKHEPLAANAQVFASRAMADEDIHAGYTKAENGEITINEPGTLTVYAYDPDKNLKSAPTSVVFTDVPTGIDVIAAEAVEGDAEYYNLQGIRVANPENGIFIRKQGNTVTKVVIR